VGRDSYHLCDIMDVYDELRGDVPGEGFSEGVLAGRLEVLELVKDEAVYQGGRVAIADKGGMTIPVQLLPSALVLLMQVRREAGGGGQGRRRRALLRRPQAPCPQPPHARRPHARRPCPDRRV
jgi:hypothetical protein